MRTLKIVSCQRYSEGFIGEAQNDLICILLWVFLKTTEKDVDALSLDQRSLKGLGDNVKMREKGAKLVTSVLDVKFKII